MTVMQKMYAFQHKNVSYTANQEFISKPNKFRSLGRKTSSFVL